MRKKIITVLTCASLIFGGSILPTEAKEIDLVNLDFENMTYEEFSQLSNVTIDSGINGDIMSIEEESPGNMAFKLFRKHENVKDSETKLGFVYNLPQTITDGKVNVSFRIKSENAYRSRWSDLGSTLTSSGGNKVFLFTHSSWVWGMGTGGQYWYTDINKQDSWITISYEVDIKNNKYTIYTIKDGVTSSASTKDSGTGDVSSIRFEIGKRNVSWTESNEDSGQDLFYWIDDIKVTINKLGVSNSSISDGAADIYPDVPIILEFDSALNDSSVNSSNFILESNTEKIPVNVLKVSDTTVTVTPQNSLKYNTDYKLTVKKEVTSLTNESMAEDYVVSFKTISLFKTNLVEGGRYTNGFVPEINILPQTDYEMQISYNGGEYTQYNGEALNETGNYTLKFYGNDAQGITQEETISFTVIGAVVPVADNVTVSGTPVIGTTLTGSYEYYDENSDPEGESICKWYRASSADGTYTEIQGENSKEYVLTEADEDSYIKFGVTPASTKEPYIGEEVMSGPFTGPMNPIVKNITVNGTVAEGNELEVTYEYYDENSDEEIKEGENATVINWYSSEKEDGTFEKIATGIKYILTSKENEHWLKVGIIPKNGGSGKQDKEFFSEVFAGASAPIAKDVKIIGTLKAGSAVGVDYKYVDNNGDPEGATKFEWYIGGSLKSTKDSITIESSDKGKEIYVVVTPVSTVEPCEGEPVSSSKEKIQSSSSSSVSSGGRNTGSGFVPVKPDVTDDKDDTEDNVNEDDNNKEENNQDSIKFTDISDNWAKNEITAMADKGIIKGKTEELFAPDDNITRAEFAALITRAFNLPKGNSEFADVNENDWFYNDVSAAAQAGYMNGSDGDFRPSEYITRQEIAVVLSNIAKDKGMETVENVPAFEDSDKIADWAKASVEYVTSLGLLKGIDDKNFAPLDNATRAQVVVVLSRIIEQ